ncbi:Ig lambda-3 chain C region [Takifugu flavidus]|uniref:Ig lambda-3 chain C region n=1 Tax=Takifugu flavidus TaxID=433684 RepID=A0A5C6MJC5_9TELE|nr:Ig lambda-3 chain C region [Takifugu flavidus]
MSLYHCGGRLVEEPNSSLTRCGGVSHPDRPPPLPRGAAAGQCHTGVSGQRGLPLTVEAELEGGGRQQHHIGLTPAWRSWGVTAASAGAAP